MKNLYPRFQENYQKDELIEHFWLNNDEIMFVETFRNEVNRQAAAILLKSLDHLGYLPDRFDQVPEQVKLFIARQLNSLWEMTKEYDWLSSAKDRHCSLIREFGGSVICISSRTAEASKSRCSRRRSEPVSRRWQTQKDQIVAAFIPDRNDQKAQCRRRADSGSYLCIRKRKEQPCSVSGNIIKISQSGRYFDRCLD